MENEIMTTQNEIMDLEISESDLALLQDIARGGQTNFVGLKKEGLEIGQEFYSEVFVQVMRIDRYSYLWQNGTNKIIDRDMTRDEAKASGYAQGMDLTLKILKPEMEEEHTLSMPQSSVWNFSKYVAFLLSKNVHPKMVVTKIRVTLKQFAKGSPAAVATFSAEGTIQAEPVNVIPVENPAPQPSVPTEQQSVNEGMPAGWS